MLPMNSLKYQYYRGLFIEKQQFYSSYLSYKKSEGKGWWHKPGSLINNPQILL